MTAYIDSGDLKVSALLHKLIQDDIAPGTGIAPQAFWQALNDIVRDLAPKNRALLQKRDALQVQIDTWCIEHRGQAWDVRAYQAFLQHIGYR